MAGSTTVTHQTIGHVRRLIVDFVGSAADGTIPDTVLPVFEGRLMELTTNPGAVAPTDNYDVTLIDAEGVDRLQGLGIDRDTANTESLPLVYSGSTIHPVISRSDVLTLKFANQAVHSATGRVILLYGPA
jgi:hypothetical protein